MGPVLQARQALEKSSRSLDGADLIEANEAFAAQSVALGKKRDWDANKANVDSGAIVLAIRPAHRSRGF